MFSDANDSLIVDVAAELLRQVRNDPLERRDNS
jgi:hypothetical protein